MADRKKIHISGLSEFQITPVLAEFLEKGNRPAPTCLILVPSFEWGVDIAKNLRFFLHRRIHLLPEAEPTFMNFEAKSRSDLNARLSAMIALRSEPGAVVLAPVSAALKKLLPPEAFLKGTIDFAVNEEASPDALKSALVELGYERVSLVEEKGTFGLRGDILDIFPPNTQDPYRIEFFGDTVEAIRTYDAESQLSMGSLDRCRIYPASEFLTDSEEKQAALNRISAVYEAAGEKADGEVRSALKNRLAAVREAVETGINRRILEHFVKYFTDSPADLADYLPENGLLAVVDPDRIFETTRLAEQEGQEDFDRFLEQGYVVSDDSKTLPGVNDLEILSAKRKAIVFTPTDDPPKMFPSITECHRYEGRRPPSFGGYLELLKSELKRYHKLGFDMTIVCGSEERIENLRELLSHEKLSEAIHLVRGNLAGGMELTNEKKVWLWDGDIFRGEKRRRRKSSEGSKNKAPIRSFADIRPGDYVVHEGHGIGKYAGIHQLTVQGKRRDYLKLQYAGSDLLYVPVEQMSLLQKYIGGGEVSPRVHKLSGSEWKNAKARAKADIAEMAKEIAQLSAARLTVKGHAFSPDTVWQAEFEEKFPYEETEDQLRSIQAIKQDMERPIAMDRLLCGDVGYGKTEVALRAVFKCAIEGKQAAVLVPTTILANQHFITFTERLRDFPLKVDILSRFRTETEQKEVVRQIEKGQVDIVIGTHRLLSNDVKFRDLGLLVVDEEQRFGVRQKEKIKQLKTNVDVLTLTATPIPRTLHLSLMSIRDMDVIEEPPLDRYPIQTYVMEENEEIIRETIRRELARKGQVFVVVRKIGGIERIVANIRKLVPEAKVEAGHGRMNEVELENRMMDFIDKKFDVLVATTIIESGLDIPNVNTILILEADHFGLSQLYQLRGRVGRSNRVAFAYFLYRRGKVLSEVATKRLRTIREFTEFGAGFKIAVRDLEIRGAGNLLGSEQSGHMVAVGYELYCRMVEDAVAELAGEREEQEDRDVQLDLPLDAYVPDSFIADEILKLQAYKNIAMVSSLGDLSETLSELEDRYGAVPECVRTLAYAALLRHLAQKAGIERIYAENAAIVFVYASAASFPIEKIAEAAVAYPNLRITGTLKPVLRFPIGNIRDGSIDGEVLSELAEFLASCDKACYNKS
ncbi:MAG: transcription-repair coupling factor [Clostridiales Family XIII bacterium]|jgi:transcription-repair coupling factor (superfamily II helicase)|nr:transcription-repair coupling factor [Clostridiales Family XIII bacterium]